MQRIRYFDNYKIGQNNKRFCLARVKKSDFLLLYKKVNILTNTQLAKIINLTDESEVIVAE